VFLGFVIFLGVSFLAFFGLGSEVVFFGFGVCLMELMSRLFWSFLGRACFSLL